MARKTKFQYGLGARPDRDDARDFRYTHALAARARVAWPPKVDNRDLLGDVFDQGDEGACVGMAVAGGAGFLHGERISPRWAYEMAQTHDEWPGEDYEGSSMRAGLKAWAGVGVAPWTFWPYKPFNTGGMRLGAAEAALQHRLVRYERLRTFRQVFHAIHVSKFVVATLNVHTGWRRPTSRNRRIRYNRRYTKLGYHAVAVVGYDEKAGYFLIRNSWGEDWGDNGHAWLKFADWKRNMSDVWLAALGLGN